MAKQIINTEQAPKAIGPYSQAVKTDNLLFISGQIPVHPITNSIPTTIEEQTHQVMKNIEAILLEAKLNWDNVIKSTIYLTDMNDFTKVNDIYASYFSNFFPARECVQVVALPKNVSVEISVIASEEK
ncbi:RidA family protein [Apibacter muscae]|uniref:RidA family protein n=1 Tax=Apibacter muscae TaxID=2509004 RepID=UPI0011AC2A8D|nr:RidA family protein [Apibacter muscae]TWP22548.1 RidA family protein [Apibacter muscae]